MLGPHAGPRGLRKQEKLNRADHLTIILRTAISYFKKCLGIYDEQTVWRSIRLPENKDVLIKAGYLARMLHD